MSTVGDDTGAADVWADYVREGNLAHVERVLGELSEREHYVACFDCAPIDITQYDWAASAHSHAEWHNTMTGHDDMVIDGGPWDTWDEDWRLT